MDVRISVLAVFLTLAISLMASSLSKLLDSHSIQAGTYSFVAFYILLRIKFFLDDFATFMNRNPESVKYAFVLGLVSWFFWLLVPLRLASLHMAALFLFISIALASFALLINCMIAKEDRYQYLCWLFFNFLYLAYLYCYLLGIDSPNGLFFMCIMIMFIDCIVNRTLDILDKPRREQWVFGSDNFE